MARNGKNNRNLPDDERDRAAAFRKRLKQMMFLYMALLSGWEVKMLGSNQFHMTKSSLGMT